MFKCDPKTVNSRAKLVSKQMRFAIAPPGHAALTSTLFSLVDVPDLRVLAELWPEAKTIWFGAGPSPVLVHRAPIAFAWLRRFRLIPSLYPFSRLIHFAANRLVWGEHRGGMFVAVNGLTGTGEAVARSWHLIAEGDDGPFIPSMACAALIRRVLAGRSPAPGARVSTHDIELDDYEPLFAARRIVTGIREEFPSRDPIAAGRVGSAIAMARPRG